MDIQACTDHGQLRVFFTYFLVIKTQPQSSCYALVLQSVHLSNSPSYQNMQYLLAPTTSNLKHACTRVAPQSVCAYRPAILSVLNFSALATRRVSHALKSTSPASLFFTFASHFGAWRAI